MAKIVEFLLLDRICRRLMSEKLTQKNMEMLFFDKSQKMVQKLVKQIIVNELVLCELDSLEIVYPDREGLRQ
jgi:hypothetical protein